MALLVVASKRESPITVIAGDVGSRVCPVISISLPSHRITHRNCQLEPSVSRLTRFVIVVILSTFYLSFYLSNLLKSYDKEYFAGEA